MNLKENAIRLMNEWGEASIPFIFIIDFEMKHPVILQLNMIDCTQLLFDFNGITNSSETMNRVKLQFEKYPIDFFHYEKSFNKVKKHLQFGNSYLTNLTHRTPIKCNLSLKQLYLISKAKYRLWMKDNFTCYSPESFIKIENGKIRSFPMKGTINASEENAENKILSNRKEMAEHATIVDLIRNDLSMVAKDVQVEKFSYVEKIITHEKQLLQVSSSIAGKLPDEYSKRIGTIIFTLLPAGSVSGAPKKKTLEIITESETHERGYYTGIAGIFDGKNLDSCVLIRFIEQENGNLFFRSGGGITVNSDPHSEYQEMIDKIYVPII